jgi:hypothetical protein
MPSTRYANLAATVALVVALGTGGAFAAGHVGARDIVKDAVRAKQITSGAVCSAEIKDGQVTSADLAVGAVGTNQLGADAVTGAKVNESTLGRVPDATAWAGATVQQINLALNDPTPATVNVINDPQIIINAGCGNGPDNEVDINWSMLGATFPVGFNLQLDHASSAPTTFLHEVNPFSGGSLSAEFGDWTFTSDRADGTLMVVHFWTYWTPGTPPNECFVRGTRTIYPAP